MGSLIGDILPFAVGMGAFPVPIIAVILLLFSPRARANGIGFAVGWTVGVAASTFALAPVTEGAGADTDRTTFAVVSWIKILLGAGLLYLAYRQWRSRPASGQVAEMPGWMKAIDGFTPGRALGTGLLLTAANPKNIILAAGAGLTIGQMGLGLGDVVLVVALFTALASVTTAGPVLYYLASGERSRALLDEVKRWLIDNNAAVLTVMLLLLSTVLMGNGIRGLSGPA